MGFQDMRAVESAALKKHTSDLEELKKQISALQSTRVVEPAGSSKEELLQSVASGQAAIDKVAHELEALRGDISALKEKTVGTGTDIVLSDIRKKVDNDLSDVSQQQEIIDTPPLRSEL